MDVTDPGRTVGMKRPCFGEGLPCLFSPKNKERKDRAKTRTQRCNKWGLKRCLASLPENRPKSAFSALCLPFSPFSGRSEEHLENPGNGGNKPLSPESGPDIL